MSNGKNANFNANLIRSDHKGQVLIEALLLAIVSLGLLMATLNYFKSTKTLDKVVNSVWSGVAQMAEYGNWPAPAGAEHPNNSDRMRTLDPR